jgi:hypothetical protein
MQPPATNGNLVINRQLNRRHNGRTAASTDKASASNTAKP